MLPAEGPGGHRANEVTQGKTDAVASPVCGTHTLRRPPLQGRGRGGAGAGAGEQGAAVRGTDVQGTVPVLAFPTLAPFLLGPGSALRVELELARGPQAAAGSRAPRLPCARSGAQPRYTLPYVPARVKLGHHDSRVRPEQRTASPAAADALPLRERARRARARWQPRQVRQTPRPECALGRSGIDQKSAPETGRLPAFGVRRPVSG